MKGCIVQKIIGGDQEYGNLYLSESETSYAWERCHRAAEAILAGIDGFPRSSITSEQPVLNSRGDGCDYGQSYPSAIARANWSGGAGWENGHSRSPHRNGGAYRAGENSAHGYPSHSYNDWNRKYLRNGACWYEDCSHVEACSAEVLRTSDFVRTVHANYGFAAELLRRARLFLPEGEQIVLSADNSDGKGHSWGSHLSVLIHKDLFWKLFRKPLTYLMLISHQVSSIPLVGQGKVGSEHGAPAVDYQISQRADFFEQLMSYQTTYRRGLVNQRDEALAGVETHNLARLHVIFYDANLAHLSLYLKAGLLQLFLAALEVDVLRNPALLLDDPLEALCRWSHDPSLQAKAQTANGRNVNAVELQAMLLDELRPFVESGECDEAVPEARQIFQHWEDTLKLLLRKDWPGLARKGVDWVLKAKTLLRAMEFDPRLNWQSEDVKFLDHAYANLDPASGLYWAHEAGGEVERLVTPEEIRHFMHNPPEDTRAWGRAMLIRRAEQECVEVTDVDWDRLSFRSGSRRMTIDLGSPLQSTRTELEPLMQRASSFDELAEELPRRRSSKHFGTIH